MKLPFFNLKQEWKPRVRIGEGQKLNRVERQLVDLVDVLDQKNECSLQRATWALNLSLILTATLIFLHGTELVHVLQNWLKHQ